MPAAVLSARRCVLAKVLLLPVLATAAPAVVAAGLGGGAGWCGTQPYGARDALWAHREEQARRVPLPRSRPASATAAAAGQVAVLLDEGDLALLRKPFDLAGAGLQFDPGGDYRVSRIDRPLAATGGSTLRLGDDATSEQRLPFEFPFFGKNYMSVWVNSDGNLTFGAGDDASTPRSLGRLLAGPPRVAALFADLDPSAGGRVEFATSADRVTVTWTDVPQYDKQDRNSFQATLWRDGRIDFAYSMGTGATLTEGVVGVAPGAEAGGASTTDLSAAAAFSGPGALAESFRGSDVLDAVAVARKFYRSHGDDYQQLVVYTNRRLTETGVFAYELTVKNPDAGLGTGQMDRSAEYGSAGRLESFVYMDLWTKYADDLERRINGEDTTLSLLAHEVGHRWLAHARFRDGAANSEELLGRQQAHWSFFVHTAGSHMEGNDIQDLGGGQFRTGPASQRYSPLDQYLMGLRPAAEVPPFFFVRNPQATSSDPARSPRSGETILGTRKDVTMAEVLAALGERQPAPGPWKQPFRQAFVYVTVGETADAAALARLERIRTAFPDFFARSTDGRGQVDTRLD